MKTTYLYLIIALCLCLQVCEAQNLNQSMAAPTKDFLLGKTIYENDSSFILIDKQYTILKPIYARIQKPTYAAFLKLREAAERDGIRLKVTSASRNFFVQKVIWEDKWEKISIVDSPEKAREILKYNSMPGTSRHHWGTELDFNGTSLTYWNSREGQKVYKWLKENASKFGFFQPYDDDKARTGYSEERWHWSFAPLSNLYTEVYKQIITSEDIQGFKGDTYVGELEIITLYVLGISPER